jgi:hypothetical protein
LPFERPSGLSHHVPPCTFSTLLLDLGSAKDGSGRSQFSSAIRQQFAFPILSRVVCHASQFNASICKQFAFPMIFSLEERIGDL